MGLYYFWPLASASEDFTTQNVLQLKGQSDDSLRISLLQPSALGPVAFKFLFYGTEKLVFTIVHIHEFLVEEEKQKRKKNIKYLMEVGGGRLILGHV